MSLPSNDESLKKELESYKYQVESLLLEKKKWALTKEKGKDSAVNELKLRLERAKKSIQTIQNEKDSIVMKFATSEKRRISGENEIKSLKDGFKLREENLLKEIEKEKQELVKVAQENKTLLEELNKIKNEIPDLKAGNANSDADLEDFCEKLVADILLKGVLQINQEIMEENSEIDFQLKIISKDNERLKNLSKFKMTSNHDIFKLIAKIEHASKESNDLKSSFALLKEENHVLKHDNANIESKLISTLKENEFLKVKVSRLEECNSKLEETRANMSRLHAKDMKILKLKMRDIGKLTGISRMKDSINIKPAKERLAETIKFNPEIFLEKIARLQKENTELKEYLLSLESKREKEDPMESYIDEMEHFKKCNYQLKELLSCYIEKFGPLENVIK